MKRRRLERLGSLLRNARRDLAGLGIAVLVVGAYHATGAASASRDSFVFMGFDTDRAYLLTAGLAAGMAAAVTAAAGCRRLTWALAGLIGLGAIFGHTYLNETIRAMRASPDVGRFDLAGWLIGTVALTCAGLGLGWAAGTLVAQVRAHVAPALTGTAAALRRRRPREIPARRLIAVALVAGLLGLSVPVLGQMLNYAPDTLMLGGAQGVPLIGENGAAAPSLPALPSPDAGRASPAPSPAPPGQASAPWLAWRPGGQGNVVAEQLPAPWTGGTSTHVSFWVYLPPGYSGGVRDYPAVYELPWPISLYDNGANVRSLLDTAIDTGRIPAEIVVFLSSGGGPFVDNECIDAAGGREWFDTFAGTSLVAFVDAHFRTIAAPAARSLLGMSQGGFCAANVLLHHPDVFRQEVSFSGYYWAAPLLGISPSARAPYAGDTQLELANSPVLEVPRLTDVVRSSLMFVLDGNPSQPFYGPQMNAFGTLLRRDSVSSREIVTPYGHSWTAVRTTLVPALQALAAREVTEGVFAGA